MSLYRLWRGVAGAAALVVATGCGSGTDPDPNPGPPDDQNIEIRNGDVTIVGSLDVPASPGPYPVMVFVPGSGRTTREDDRAALDIALPHGVAVFRYDKRGLGQSSGTFEEVSVENSELVLALRAADVRAIVDYLATRPDVRADRIFLWGTSQGAWVAPLVAAQSQTVAFIIAVSGGGSSVGTSDYYDELTDDPAVTVEEATAALVGFPGPYGYDPAPTLGTLQVPVLWLFGGLDRSNPSLYDIEVIEQLRETAGRDFTVALFPRMSHEMIDVDTGAFPVDLFPTVFAWVMEQFAQQAPTGWSGVQLMP